MNRKHRLLAFSISFSLVAGAQNKTAASKDRDTTRLSNILASLADISQLPQYAKNTFSGQVSSYDLTGGNDDGFNGQNSFIRRNADSSLVIFDVNGPGVITRIWTPTPTNDTLDFYLDGKDRPVMSVKYNDLFSGKQEPFAAPLSGAAVGGYYCYFPILFNKGCVIVCRGKLMRFHQVQYELFPPGSFVKSFSGKLSVSDTNALHTISRLWSKKNRSLYDFQQVSGHSESARKVVKQFELQPGKPETIFSSANGGRILGIECSPANAFEGLNKLIDIEITWDDDKTPAVYCPLADFFGYAFGNNAMQSLLLGTNGDVNYCYLPMPFDKKACIRLLYRNSSVARKDSAIRVSTTVYYTNQQRIAGNEGRLYTSWNKGAADGQPHVFLNAKGRGHLVGTVLQAQGLRPGMTYFFEGDDSTVVDGEMRLHGTGSEDYFNGGWYALAGRWAQKQSLPLHGCLDYSLPYCRTGGYRFYLSDKVSFEKSIFHSIEHGPSGNHAPVDYTSLSFYYGERPPVAVNVPSNDLTKVYMPDTLMMYPQLMKIDTANILSFKTSWAYGTGGMSHIYTANNESALKVSISEIPAGKYRLMMDFVRNRDGAEFSVWLGGNNISGWVSADAVKEQVERNYFIGNIDHADSKSKLTVRFKTAAGKDKFTLSRLIFIKG